MCYCNEILVLGALGFSVKLWEPVAMEREGDLEGEVGPVDLGEGLSVQQEQVGPLLIPIEDYCDQHPVVFGLCTWSWNKEHLSGIVTVLGSHLVVFLSSRSFFSIFTRVCRWKSMETQPYL